MIGYSVATDGFGDSVSCFSNASVGANSGDENFSVRQRILVTTPSKRQVRVTFSASSAGSGFNVDNASIALQGTATAPSTITIPTNVFFDGKPGFSISPSTTIVSDWVNFVNFANGDAVFVCFDISSTNGNDTSNSSTGNTVYFKAASDGYNLATVSGYSNAANTVNGVAAIEVR